MSCCNANPCSNQDLVKLFGNVELWSPSTATGAKASVVLANKMVLLYFSASFCGPCQRFTPLLKELYNKVKIQHDFELVYCSMDLTDQEYKSYTCGMPWWCIPRGHDLTKLLAQKYGAQGIPHLVILDKDAKVICADGVGEVSMDPTGKDFPWRPKPISQIMLGSILKSPNGSISTQELANKYLMLYFSAHWSPPCKIFTPRLCNAYKKLKAMRHDFELIFVSKDNSEEAFIDYYKEMPFCALPFQEHDAMVALFKLYDIRALPSLIILGPTQPDGNRPLINKDLVNIIQHSDYISDFPYHPKPYGDLTTTTDDINTCKCLVVFHENGDDEDQEDVVEAIKMAAENYKNGTTTVKFYWALQPTGLAANVRRATGLQKMSQEPLMVLLDIPDNGAYYLSDETDISIDSILDFVRAPGQRREIA